MNRRRFLRTSALAALAACSSPSEALPAGDHKPRPRPEHSWDGVGFGPLQDAIEAGRQHIDVSEFGNANREYTYPTRVPDQWEGRIVGQGGWFGTQIKAPFYVPQSRTNLERLTFWDNTWYNAYQAEIEDCLVFGPDASWQVGVDINGSVLPRERRPSAVTARNLSILKAQHAVYVAANWHHVGGSIERLQNDTYFQSTPFGNGGFREVRFEHDARSEIRIVDGLNVDLEKCSLILTDLVLEESCDEACGWSDLTLKQSRVRDYRRAA